ncbi:MAG TPA: flagellar basal body P-ring formation chaperone FlgA [Pirellulales bacterium]|jgi:flagella basal body P-ring formation protein FlgA|nr:flagellar basal body P-ring formation chaperone FlgA [Pirellulales bacterium]
MRNLPLNSIWLASMLAVVLGASAAAAAEVQLRGECRTDKGVVTLGDVADVYSSNPQQTATLIAIELCPAPPTGQHKILRVHDIQDVLELHGLGRSEQRFSGASQVTIGSGRGDAAPRDRERHLRVTAPMARNSQHQASDAIVKYLQDNADPNEPWEVETLNLDDEQVRALCNAGSQIQVTGGIAPWTGLQVFTLVCGSSDGPVSITAKAKVSLPPAIVVATRTIGRGTMIRPGDVQLQRVAGRTGPSDAFSRIDDVVGQEATKSIAEGQQLDAQYLRHPLMVKKGEVVTVYARTSGIQIRTTARCRDDGSLGELVNVESLADRKLFLARVSAPQEVEVYARATTPRAEAAEPERARPALLPRNSAARPLLPVSNLERN